MLACSWNPFEPFPPPLGKKEGLWNQGLKINKILMQCVFPKFSLIYTRMYLKAKYLRPFFPNFVLQAMETSNRVVCRRLGWREGLIAEELSREGGKH